MSAEPLLVVDELSVELPSSEGSAWPVRDVSFSVARGEVVGVAGESGSGKTITSLAIARLLPKAARSRARSLRLDGRDLQAMSQRELDRFLRTRLAMVFQDPMSSLNPARRIGSQMIEGVRTHRGLSRRDALALAATRLREMRIEDAEQRLRQYPHELSGGMRQRTMLATALMGEPALLIADEPTTALDVTVQAQVMDLLHDVNERHETAVLLISHNIALLSEICDRVVVMYAGKVVEDLSVEMLVRAPAHPYTQALLHAVPTLEAERSAPLAVIEGSPPNATDVVAGCPFAPRCPVAEDGCRSGEVPLNSYGPEHLVACRRVGHAAMKAAGSR